MFQFHFYIPWVELGWKWVKNEILVLVFSYDFEKYLRISTTACSCDVSVPSSGTYFSSCKSALVILVILVFYVILVLKTILYCYVTMNMFCQFVGILSFTSVKYILKVNHEKAMLMEWMYPKVLITTPKWRYCFFKRCSVEQLYKKNSKNVLLRL